MKRKNGRIRRFARPVCQARTEILEPRIAPAVFVVTNTSDAGAGSLRQAILSADAGGGGSITFNISGESVHMIAVQSALPVVSVPVTIDGTTQLGYSGAPLIEINGASAGNNVVGLKLTGGSSTLEGIDVDGFTAQGIYLQSGGNDVVKSCYIGVAPSGERPVPNGSDGLYLDTSANDTIGGASAGDGNLISGNKGHGINIASGACGNTLIEENTIGTDASGTEPLGNNGNAINVNATSPNNQILNNLLSGNGGSGVGYFSSSSSNNLIEGNLIGTDRSGVAPIANGGKGVDNGGPAGTRIIDNVISGNNGPGVNIGFSSATGVVQGNMIGVAADGIHALGNLGYGVTVNFSGTDELIGGTATGQGNIIAYNGQAGIELDKGSVGVAIEGNAVYSNHGIGIDLGGDGVTLNTPGGPHNGANNLQNFPVLTSAQINGDNTTVAGTLNSAPGTTFRLEFFASPGADPTGYGAGRTVLGAASVTTDSSGNVTFTATLSTTVPAGEFVSATATDATGDTSEFSGVVRIPLPTTGPGSGGGTFIVTNGFDTGPGSLRQAITAADFLGGGTITFNMPGHGVHTISPASALPTITAPVTIDGTSQPDYTGAPLIVLDGASAGTSNVIGLLAMSAAVTIEGLVIDDFPSFGVSLQNASGSVVRACYIGVDATGSIVKANGNQGITIGGSSNVTIGGVRATDGNVISGNKSGGIQINNTSNSCLIQNNFIGTDASGTEPLPNQGDGLNFSAAAQLKILGNVISGNSGDGIDTFSGTNAANALIQNNLIGTDGSGVGPLPNSGNGINIDGAPGAQILGNVVSANSGQGISLNFNTTTNTVIQGNDIGVAKDGIHALGNLNGGIQTGFGASNSLIGGTGSGQGNVIAYNARVFTIGGIAIDTASTGFAVEGNEIYSNFGVGIDLGGQGVTTNSPGGPHTGANDIQNYPLLASSQSSNGSTVISGSLNSTPSTSFRLEFFASPGFDPTGYGQGKIYLGSTSVNTDPSGNVTFTATLGTTAPGGYAVSATATDSSGNTSEFSPDVLNVVPISDVAVQMTSSPSGNLNIGDTLTYTLTAVNDGSFLASNVVITDPLPAGVSFQAASSSQGSASVQGSTVTVSLGSLAAGALALVNIQVDVTAAGSIVNTATISASTADQNPSNNTATVINNAEGGPHITLTPNLTSPTYGQALYFVAAATGGSGQPTPTGKVQLLLNGANVGSAVALFGGAATVAPPSMLGAGTYSFAVSYSGDANYLSTTTTPITVTIGKAHLVVTADSKSMTYGGTLPKLTSSLSGFVNGDTAAVVTGTPGLTTLGSTLSPVGTYPITPTAGTLTAVNYDFPTFVTGVLTILKAALTVTADEHSMLYGGTLPTLTATVSGFLNGDTAANSVSGAAACSTQATSASNVGTYSIDVGIGTLASGNYNFVNFVGGYLTINKAHLTVTANPATMTYGGAFPAFSATFSGFVNNDTPAVVSGAAGFSPTANAQSPVGSYPLNLTAGTLTAMNYDFATLIASSLTVTPAHLTVTANSLATPLGVIPTLTYSLSGFVNGDTSAVASGAPVLSTTATTTSPPGTYAISVSAGTLTAVNYDFPTLVPGVLSLGKALLVVTANAQMTYGGSVPTLMYSVTGFVNGDTTSILSGAPMLGTTATAQSPAGAYPITVSAGTLSVGGEASVYNIAYVNGTLTVGKAHLTVTADPKFRYLNNANPTLTATISGFVNGDAAAVVSGAPTLATTAIASSPFGAYPITISAGTLSARNYDFPNLVAGVLTVQNEPSGDLTGIGHSEPTVFRPATAQWFVLAGNNTVTLPTFGGTNLNDIPVAGDYDGVGHAEQAVYRPSTGLWFVLEPNGNTETLPRFGWPEHDVPVSGDYDGVGHTEQAVYRPSTGQWFVLEPNGTTEVLTSFGWANHDIPVPGDFDGVGHTEEAVYRPSTAQWFVLEPNGKTETLPTFGWAGLTHDLPVPGDYDGVGHTEEAVYRPSTAQWFVLGPNGKDEVLAIFGWTNLRDLPVETPIEDLVQLGVVGEAVHLSSLTPSAVLRISPVASTLTATMTPLPSAPRRSMASATNSTQGSRRSIPSGPLVLNSNPVTIRRLFNRSQDSSLPALRRPFATR